MLHKDKADPQLPVPDPTITFLLSIVDFGQVKKVLPQGACKERPKKRCIKYLFKKYKKIIKS